MMEPRALPEILIAHPWMGRGGSEATAMWALDTLQDKARVTFTTASPVDWASLNGIYGTDVSVPKVRFIPAPRIPGISTGSRLAFWQRAYFERHCRRLAKRFDVCISAYNPIDFHRPGIQLIGDFSFHEECRLELYPNASERIRHRPSRLRRAYLAAGEIISGAPDNPIASRGDCIVANSRWTASQIERAFGLQDLPVLYPPSLHCEPDRVGVRQPLSFVCMGRITPEKEIETIIAILDHVREAGYPVTLDVLGRFSGSAYSQTIRKLVDERGEWIHTPGFLDPDDKGELFATRSFGLHACRVEAFGISVAEMAAAGLIPFVPSEGGSCEAVGEESLAFENKEDAVRKIIARIENPDSLPTLRRRLCEHATRFRPRRFADRMLEIVRDFIGAPLSTP